MSDEMFRRLVFTESALSCLSKLCQSSNAEENKDNYVNNAYKGTAFHTKKQKGFYEQGSSHDPDDVSIKPATAFNDILYYFVQKFNNFIKGVFFCEP
jgi:hypothetical protein